MLHIAPFWKTLLFTKSIGDENEQQQTESYTKWKQLFSMVGKRTKKYPQNKWKYQSPNPPHSPPNSCRSLPVNWNLWATITCLFVLCVLLALLHYITFKWGSSLDVFVTIHEAKRIDYITLNRNHTLKLLGHSRNGTSLTGTKMEGKKRVLYRLLMIQWNWNMNSWLWIHCK